MGKIHHLFQSMAKELGIQAFDSHFDGKTVLIWNGKKVVVPMQGDWATTFLDIAYDDLSVSPKDREAAQALHRQFLSLAQTIDAEQPWRSSLVRELDAQTIESWRRDRTDSELAHYILQWYTRVGGSGGFDPGDSSILHLAQTQKASPQGEVPEAWLLYGAAGQLAPLLARQIKGEIRTTAAARAVGWSGIWPLCGPGRRRIQPQFSCLGGGAASGSALPDCVSV